MRSTLSTIGIILLVLGLAWYLYFGVRVFRRGPEVIITSPAPNSLITEPLVTITGAAPGATHITMNGRQIFIDPSGHFEETLLLTPGYTIIDVAVRDRFDRTATSTLTLVHVPSPPPEPIATETVATSSLETNIEE